LSDRCERGDGAMRGCDLCRMSSPHPGGKAPEGRRDGENQGKQNDEEGQAPVPQR